MGKIELELQDWMGLRQELLGEISKRMQVVESFNVRIASSEADIERLEKAHEHCSHETNQRLAKIESLLDKGKNVIVRWVGKVAVFGYRSLAIYLLYKLATENPELAAAARELLIP